MKKNFLKLLIIMILVLLLAIILLSFFSNKIMPIYMNYAEGEIKSLVTTVITKSINDDLIDNISSDDLFIIKDENNSNMTIVDFDPVVINKLMSNISDTVYDNLKLLSEKDKDTLLKYNVNENIFYIPSGVIFNSPVLNNLGPKIPINMEIISLVNPNIETKVTEYGINNSLVEVFVNVVASVRMILPLRANEITVTVVVPIAVKIIQGMVPDYYLGGTLRQ